MQQSEQRPADQHAPPQRWRSARSGGDDIFGLLLSVLLFGYFGFFQSWAHERTLEGELLPMVVVLKWTLRISTIAFAIAAILALARRRESHLVAGVTGLLGAIAFAAVAIWDFATPEYFAGPPTILLAVFALWNGYVSFLSVRTFLAAPTER